VAKAVDQDPDELAGYCLREMLILEDDEDLRDLAEIAHRETQFKGSGTPELEKKRKIKLHVQVFDQLRSPARALRCEAEEDLRDLAEIALSSTSRQGHGATS